jgi:hypothetical protein
MGDILAVCSNSLAVIIEILSRPRLTQSAQQASRASISRKRLSAGDIAIIFSSLVVKTSREVLR